MNRQIKFRAWDSINKEMELDIHTTAALYSLGQCLEMTDMEVMQFTGFQDKNGKDIYEGDIVSGFNGEVVGQIAWNNDGAYFWLFGNTLTDSTHSEYLSKEYMLNFEVIGNIYEN